MTIKNTYLSETLLIFGLFFLSGFSSLIYESAWSQQLGLVFGSTELAIAAVLASYMAGLALGASLASRYITHIVKPIKAYAIIEILVALSALSIPWLLDWVKNLYAFFYTTEELSSISSKFALMYVFGSFLVLLIPTTLMGATLPLLSKFCVHKDSTIGGKIGALYSINTLGACAGVLVSAFVLLPKFGLSTTIVFAVFVNVVIFMVGIIVFSQKSTDQNYQSIYPKQELNNRWILHVMLFSGLVSLAQELMWTRLLSQILGSSVYSFGVMLFVFLLGISLGAAIGSWLCKKFKAIAVFSIIQAGIGVSFLLSFYFANHLTQLDIDNDFGTLGFVFDGINIGLMTLLPGALFIGATFPLAVQISSKEYHQSGQVAARVYSWNTVGAIFGSLIMGFYLLPHWGFANSAKTLFFISLTLAFVAALYSSRKVVLISLTSLFVLAALITPVKEPMQLLKYTVLGKQVQKGDVEFFGIGESATVMLLANGANKRLLTNGLPESSIQIKGARISNFYLASWLSMLPVLSHPQAKNMLIIGLGAGLTLNSVPKSIEQIDVVELEQQVIKANQKMAAFRGIDPLKEPRLTLIHNDARNALNNSTKMFDIIVSQPSHPWTAGAANLYTREFFSLVKEHLLPQGQFVQWIGMRFVDKELLKSLLATLNSQFSYVQLYQPMSRGGLVFLASDFPIVIDEKKFNQRLNPKQWQQLGMTSWRDFQIALQIDSPNSKLLSQNIDISSDYYNILKIRSPKILNHSLNQKLLVDITQNYDPFIASMNSENSFVILRELIRQRALIRAKKLIQHIKNKHEKLVANAILADKINNNNQTRKRLIKLLDQGVKTQDVLFYLLQRDFNAFIQDKLAKKVRLYLQKDEVAQQIANGWRLYQLQKWRAIKQMDTSLANINRDHPAYFLANRLRLAWRSFSDNKIDLVQAMNMIKSELAINQELPLYNLWFKVSLKLGLYHESIASIYDLASIQSKARINRKKMALHLRNLLNTLDEKINSAILDDPSLKQSLNNLKQQLYL